MNHFDALILVIIIDAILFGVLLLKHLLSSILRIILRMFRLLSTIEVLSSGKNKSSVEIPEDELPFKPRYDVDAFRRRMQNLAVDEDGLYTPPPESVEYGFTGTEVLSSDYEIDLERRMGL